MYTYTSARPPALISRKLRIDQNYFLVAELEAPAGYRYYNEAAAKMEHLLLIAAEESIGHEDLDFEALVNIKEPFHAFQPGTVVYQSPEMPLPVVYKYLVLTGTMLFNITYSEAMSNHVNDRETAYSICFPKRSD